MNHKSKLQSAISEETFSPKIDLNIPTTQAARGLALSDLARSYSGNLIFLARNESSALNLKHILDHCLTSHECLHLPDWDISAYENTSPSPKIMAARGEVLTKILNSDSSKFLVFSISSAMHLLPPKEFLEAASSYLYVGKEIELEQLITKLINAGFVRNSKAMDLGEFASRGNILDIVLDNSGYGYRIEFEWDSIGSIRSFYTISQISTKKLDRLTIAPTNEIILNDETIQKFKDNFLTKWGLAYSSSNLYRHLTSGIKYQGYEMLKPMFFEYLESIFDYITPNMLIFDNFYQSSLEHFDRQINELYQTRLSSNELASQDERYYTLAPYEIWHSKQSFYGNIEQAEYKISFASENNAEESSDDKIAKNDFNPAGDSEKDSTLQTIYKNIKSYEDLNLNYESLGLSSADIASKLNYLRDNYPSYKIAICSKTTGQLQRISQILSTHELTAEEIGSFQEDKITASASRYLLCVLPVEGNFKTQNIIFLSSEQLIGKQPENKSSSHVSFRQKNAAIQELSALAEGDLVVHKDHGVGRFKYIETLKTLGRSHDCLLIEYSGGDKLYIPAENLDLLKRYGSSEGELDKLGGSSWQNRKAKSKRKVSITAEKLIQIAAKREQTQIAHIFPNPEIYDEFCNRFPYPETEDQLNAIDEIKQDLASDKPMDRLLCGDVGFGKTEVCMRAACAVVSNNNEPLEDPKQVIVIAPTTILAKQHYNTFRERFRGFNFNIRHISRLVNAREGKKIKKEFESGEVDILIGTHALLSKSLQPHNLRFLIIDEEQHFGVAQKEKLKSLKNETNVLSLSATPIPRTLQMSMLGIKSLSLITTPPIDRLAVRTNIIPYDKLMIRDALYKEYFRGGKSFYVTPKISDLEEIYNDLTQIVPDLKIAIAHGRMPASEIDKTMNKFYEGELDILLSTTIIESGIDVPEANTIIINNADKMGLSQLYQLRGRVGRGKVRGYAYLTYDKKQPPTQNAIKRLEVMQDVDSLGAGFKIATNDMDIRGSGNLVGDEQSGHIKEVGVELYQEMLKEEIDKLRQQDPSEADNAEKSEINPQINLGLSVLIPPDYIADSNMRLNLYRRIAKITEKDELDNFAIEMIDRFGPLPQEFENLVDTIEIKQLCKQISILKLEAGPKGFVLTFAGKGNMQVESLLQFVKNHPKEAKLKPDNKLIYLVTPSKNKLVKQVRDLLQELIQLNENIDKMSSNSSSHYSLGTNSPDSST